MFVCSSMSPTTFLAVEWPVVISHWRDGLRALTACHFSSGVLTAFTGFAGQTLPFCASRRLFHDARKITTSQPLKQAQRSLVSVQHTPLHFHQQFQTRPAPRPTSPSSKCSLSCLYNDACTGVQLVAVGAGPVSVISSAEVGLLGALLEARTAASLDLTWRPCLQCFQKRTDQLKRVILVV